MANVVLACNMGKLFEKSTPGNEQETEQEDSQQAE